MESGEFAALLATDTLPVALPVEDGVNVAVRFAVCPGVRMRPEETPDALKPAPEIVTFEIVTFEFPAFVNVMFCVPLLDTLTLPKLTEDELEFSKRVDEVTVKTAALLVALPAPLLTATVNLALLSAIVSAGVVYVEEVAPLIAAPFLLHWYVMGDVPLAATVNNAVFPTITDWLAGCVMIVGATVAPVTVSRAALLVALPALLLTTTVNFELLSAVVSAGVA
jgi:hypothetical protein